MGHTYRQCHFIAKMNSDIPLETAGIFFLANLRLKYNISSVYVMVDFICENYKMKNSRPQWDSNPVPFAYKANALTIALRDLISIKHLRVDCDKYYMTIITSVEYFLYKLY